MYSGTRTRVRWRQLMPVPVLVLCGGLDTLTPPALSVDMAGLVPDSRLVILDDVGHLSSLEAPQAVTGALQQLFDAL